MTAPILFSAILTNPMILAVSLLWDLRCHSPEVPGTGTGCGLSCPIWMKASWRAGGQPWNKYCGVMRIITLWENYTCSTSLQWVGGGWCWLARKCWDIFLFITADCLTVLCLQPARQSYNHIHLLVNETCFCVLVFEASVMEMTTTLTINGLKLFIFSGLIPIKY